MHLAICKEILNSLGTKKKDRFIIGNLLPDAIDKKDKRHLEIHAKTHFNKYNKESNKKYHDFTEFLTKYNENIKKDELYLGYYLHLIQYSVFGKYFYNDKELYKERKKSDFKQKMYRDYNLLNKYLIEKYDLISEINIVKDFSNKELLGDINNIYNYD